MKSVVYVNDGERNCEGNGDSYERASEQNVAEGTVFSKLYVRVSDRLTACLF